MTIEIDGILAKLDPKTRARVQSAQDVKVEKQITPSIGLNFALRGGLGYGRQVLVWGNKSAGKSSFCLQMIALAQKEGKTCAWIDAEASYDQSWAEQLGVDSSSLIYSPAKTINDMVDVATKLMDAGVDLIVVDSINVNDSSGSKANVALIKNLAAVDYVVTVLHFTQKEIQLEAVYLF